METEDVGVVASWGDCVWGMAVAQGRQVMCAQGSKVGFEVETRVVMVRESAIAVS